MTTVADILASPGLDCLRPDGGEAADRTVRELAIVEGPEDLAELPPDCIAVVTPRASMWMAGYQLDIATRRAAEAHAAALVLTGPTVGEIPVTSRRVARRSALTLIVAPPGMTLASLVTMVCRALAGGADIALAQAIAALQALADANVPAEACAAVSRALGLPIQLRRAVDGEIEVPVLVDGNIEEHLAAPNAGGPLGDATRLALQVTVDEIGRQLLRRRRVSDISVRSRTRVLSTLLVASSSATAELIERARGMGLPIDGWHLVLRFDIEAGDMDEIARFELTESIALSALGAVGRSGWYLASGGHVPLLIRMWTRDPGRSALTPARKAAETVLAELSRRFPDVEVRCALGSVHAGVEGLRTSAAEAQAALSTSGGGRRVVAFDQTGLHRTIVEWYTSAAARESVRELLQPLTALDPDKAATAVQTLRSYLDNQGSLAATAAALSLHRNAVAYRIKRILKTLDVDVSDPDQRLALQLACRAWQLH